MLEHALESLETAEDIVVCDPGVGVEPFGEEAQLVSHGPVTHLSRDARNHLGISRSDTRESLRTERPVNGGRFEHGVTVGERAGVGLWQRRRR